MDRRSEQQNGSSKGRVMNYQKEFPNKFSFDDKGKALYLKGASVTLLG